MAVAWVFEWDVKPGRESDFLAMAQELRSGMRDLGPSSVQLFRIEEGSRGAAFYSYEIRMTFEDYEALGTFKQEYEGYTLAGLFAQWFGEDAPGIPISTSIRWEVPPH